MADPNGWDGKDRRATEPLGELIPRPDPSALTTSALHREVAILRELFDTNLRGEVRVIKAELEQIRLQFAERDERYKQRHDASQEAIRTAVAGVERAVAVAFAGSEKAILKAEVSIEKRADATYVALGELTKHLNGLVPREEAEAKLKSLEDKLTEAARRLDRMEGSTQGMEKGWGFIVGAIGTAAAVIAIIIAFT